MLRKFTNRIMKTITYNLSRTSPLLVRFIVRGITGFREWTVWLSKHLKKKKKRRVAVPHAFLRIPGYTRVRSFQRLRHGDINLSSLTFASHNGRTRFLLQQQLYTFPRVFLCFSGKSEGELREKDREKERLPRSTGTDRYRERFVQS